MKTGCIYTLEDPITGLVRYVGQTISKPENRYAQHIFQWKRSKGKLTHNNAWIKSLYDKNLKPFLNIIEDNIDQKLLNYKEIEYIKLYKSFGALLCNHTIGGEGTKGYKQTEEAKQKRLNTLSKSLSWKEKHVRHSNIMKTIHKEKKCNFGYAHLSEEKRKMIGEKIKNNRPNNIYIVIKNKINEEVLTFSSIKQMKVYFDCNIGTVRDFIYNKRKTIIFKDYILLENKNKYDVKKSKKD